MARLVYAIDGDITGLTNAVNQAVGLIKELDTQSGKINIGSAGISNIGASLATISSGLNQVKTSADSANVSLQFAKGVAALDQLGAKLSVISGNSILFGQSLKDQEAELSAYQGALNKLLALGFDPLDADVTALKIKIDALTESMIAQNAVVIKAPSSTIIDKTQFNEPTVNVSGSTSGLTGAQVLLREFDNDLAAGKITAEEYAASVALIGQQTTTTSVKIEEEIGILAGLNSQLNKLKTQRLNIADPTALAAQNAQIQELEAEITRFGNAGKVGFNNIGVSAENSRTPIENVGKGLTRSFGYLRQIAYILPGIGIAGIFNLAFEAISKVAENLDLFTKRLNEAELTSKGFVGAFASADYASAIKSVQELTVNIQLAKEGFLDKDKVIDEYNNSIGRVTGNIDTLDAAEQGLVAHAQDFIRITLLKAAATVILNDAAKDAADVAIKNQKAQDKIDELQKTKKVVQANTDPNAFGGDARGLINSINKDITSLTQDIAQNNIDLKSSTDKRIAILTNFNTQQAALLRKNGASSGAATGGGNAISDIAKLQNNNKDLEIQLAQQKDQLIVDDQTKSLSQRLLALKDFYDKSKQIITNDSALELSVKGQSNSQIININDKKNLALYKADVEYNKKRQELLKSSATADPFQAISDSITSIFNKINAKSSESGLTGYQLAVQKIKDTYTQINAELDKQQQKLTTLQNKGLSPTGQTSKDNLQIKLDSTRVAADAAKVKELKDAEITEAQRVANEIQRINDEFGVRADVSRSRELAQVQKMYDAEVAKAGVTADILNTLNAGRATAIQAINAKYIDQERQTYARITDIANQAFAQLDSGEAARTDKINIESQKRITAANAEFNKLRDLAKGLPQSATDSINKVQLQVTAVIKQGNAEQISIEISKNFATAMQSAVDGFVQNFYTSLTTLGAQRQTIDDKYNQQLQQQQVAYANSVAAGDGQITAAQNQATVNQINNLKKLEQQSTTSFGAIFSSLFSKFTASFNESILSSFTKQFTENLGKTLLAPTAKQLTISPEQQGAQNASVLLKNAGNDLATQINNAGNSFAAKINSIQINPSLLSGASGGSSLLPAASGISASQAISNQISSSGLEFSSTVAAGAAGAAATGIAAATQSATITDNAATTAGNKISSAAAGLAAAASLAGGLISGLGKPTNSTTSALGGAVSGAGQGALIGTALAPFTGGTSILVGAIAGFVIGGISGLFSASKAKKQEELQQQQLAQQQLTNELLARQNALAYTSSIIGRMTTQGVITGTDINSFGQLTATVSGKNIQFVLDRNSNGR